MAALFACTELLTLGSIPQQQPNPVPQYIDKAYPASPTNLQPDKNAQMLMHEQIARRKNFDAANLERKRQIESDCALLLSLARELKASIDTSDQEKLSAENVRRAELMEKLAHNIKEKMKLTVN